MDETAWVFAYDWQGRQRHVTVMAPSLPSAKGRAAAVLNRKARKAGLPAPASWGLRHVPADDHSPPAGAAGGGL